MYHVIHGVGHGGGGLVRHEEGGDERGGGVFGYVGGGGVLHTGNRPMRFIFENL